MGFGIINVRNTFGISKNIPRFLKCNFSTIQNDVQKIIKENEKEDKLKLSLHTQNLLTKNKKNTNDTILHFERNMSTHNQNDIINNELAKYENIDISTITKPLKYPVVLCHGKINIIVHTFHILLCFSYII